VSGIGAANASPRPDWKPEERVALVDESQKLVVSAEEVRQVPESAATDAAYAPFAAAPPKPPALAPWWAKLLLSPLVLAPPLLFLAVVILRNVLRNQPLKKKAVWLGYSTTLLIISGVLTSAALTVIAFRGTGSEGIALPLRIESLDRLEAYPTIAAPDEMNAAELFAAFKPLLFIVTPAPPFGLLSKNYLQHVPVGAAVMVFADATGYLLATNRHVVETGGLFSLKGPENEVVVFTEGRDAAKADVIARHQALDLALLWLDRQPGGKMFLQAIRPFADIRVGERVYVMGHPERQFFTMSDGLISRIGDDTQIQISAPISPGNSGGPVYDTRGNLLGIVTSMVDRTSRPNAQNLNFALRADLLIDADGWEFVGQGGDRLRRFQTAQTLPDVPPPMEGEGVPAQ
jgi:hypothetical protein